MRKSIISALVVLAMLTCLIPASAGTISEGHTWGFGNTDAAYAIDTDGLGNVYIAGVTFNGYETLGFVAKFDRLGQLVWDRTLGSGSGAEIYDLAVDEAGNAYACGSTYDSLNGIPVGFVAKLSPDGDLVYDRLLEGFTGPWEIELDSQGFVVAGDWNWCTGLAAFTADGTLRWSVNSDYSDGGLVYGLAVDASDNVIMIMDRDSPNIDVGFAMFNSNGNLVKQVSYQSSVPDEYSWDVAVGADGNIFGLGWSISDGLLFLLKLSPTLDFVWGEMVGNPLSYQECWKMVAQPDGTICAIGSATNVTDGSSGAALFKFTSSGALVEASYYPTTLNFRDATALPLGGILISGSCIGPVLLTPYALPGVYVMPVSNMMAIDTVNYLATPMPYYSGLLVAEDPVATIDSYDPALNAQAWFGYVDAVISQFPVEISVRQSNADPSTVTLRGTASGGVRPYTYAWQLGDGSSATGARTTHVYASSGVFHVTLTALDSAGAVGYASVDIVVPGPPIISGIFSVPSPSVAHADTTFYVDAYDPDGGALALFDWSFGDGLVALTTTGVVTHAYNSSGLYTLGVTVWDDEGMSAWSTWSVEVIDFNNQPWVSFSVTPNSGNVSTMFTVDASGCYDNEDPVSSLQVRWDWEYDGYWDTNWTTNKVAYHSYYSPGTYTIRLEVMDTGGLTNNTTRQVTVSQSGVYTVLYEPFDTYGSLDPGWSFWSYPWENYNHFEILNGTLLATNAPGWDAHDAWNAYANWTRLVEYNGSLSVSFSIYLPYDSDYKEGIWGQWPAVIFYDQAGDPLLITRWLMDQWGGAPSGWAYIDGNSQWASICSFTAGWHEVEIVMNKTLLTWTAVFDGVAYPGQSYTGMPTVPDDISKVSFVNGLREETVVVAIDDLRIELAEAPWPYNYAPEASFTASPQYGYVGDVVTFDASGSYDPDGTIVSYNWDFGDGMSGSGVIASHAYNQSGTYVSALTVTDDQGATDTATVMIVVLVYGARANWTFLVYLDGDNNLEEVALIDFTEMSSSGSTDAVNIVVQMDRHYSYSWDYGDWTGTKRFYVTPGMTPTAENAVMDMGELNMGDSATLTDFLEWGVMSYPAENYMLVLWDHGGGWDGAVCWDETDSWDALTLDEIEIAMNTSWLDTGEWIDSVGFDACLMGMAEVAYEIREYTDVLVFSEETIPWDGWPYDTVVADLVANPFITPAEFAADVVIRYAEYYGASGWETLSAADVADLNGMFLLLDDFALDLMSALPAYKTQILESWGSAEYFSYNDYIDLYDFANEVRNRIPLASLQASADAIMAALPATMLATFNGMGHPDAHGLSIYLPSASSWYITDYRYLDMSIDLAWDDFIEAFIQTEPDIYEPDNTWMDANSIAFGETQVHNIDQLGADVDWVTFTLAQESQVRIRTSGPNDSGDSVLRLYNESLPPYSPIAENDDYNGLWSQITTWLGPGQYWVEVSSYEHYSEIPYYELTLEQGPFPNEPPVADFYSYGNFYVGGYVYFNGGWSYDPDGYIISYYWDLGDGTYSTSSFVEHVYWYAGDYNVTLTVTDDAGLSSSMTHYIWISGSNLPPVPVGIITPENPSVGEMVTFDASMSYDPDGYVIYWYWYFGDGYSSSGAIVHHSYSYEGTYYVQLEVGDNSGTWVYTTYNVTVRDWEPVPPVAVIAYSPSQPQVGQTVQFDGTHSVDPDGYLITFIWQFGDGQVGYGAVATHTYQRFGTYMVSLSVIDDQGMSDETVTTIKVVSLPNAEFEYSPLMPIAGQQTNFYAWGSSDQSGIVEYLWSFGDGSYASGWQASHVFAQAGMYIVTLSVRNADGLNASHMELVTVGNAQLLSIYGDSNSGSAGWFGIAPTMALSWIALLGICSTGSALRTLSRRL